MNQVGLEKPIKSNRTQNSWNTLLVNSLQALEGHYEVSPQPSSDSMTLCTGPYQSCTPVMHLRLQIIIPINGGSKDIAASYLSAFSLPAPQQHCSQAGCSFQNSQSKLGQ